MVRLLKSLCIAGIILLLVLFVSYTEFDNSASERKSIITEKNDSTIKELIKSEATPKETNTKIILDLYNISYHIINMYFKF